MKEYLQHLGKLWQARAPQERRLLVLLGVFLLTAALAEGLWSAHQSRQQLHHQLPQLQLQLDTLQQQSVDIRALRSQPLMPAATEGALLETASTLARNAGLNLTPGQWQLESPRQLRLRAEIPFDHWLEAIAALQRNAQLRLVQCKVEALTGTSGQGQGQGQVRVDALFSLPDPT